MNKKLTNNDFRNPAFPTDADERVYMIQGEKPDKMLRVLHSVNRATGDCYFRMYIIAGKNQLFAGQFPNMRAMIQDYMRAKAWLNSDEYFL